MSAAGVKIQCGRCGARFHVAGAPGGRVSCPQCGVDLVLPKRAAPAKRPDPLIGRTLGRYEILALVGKGSMGAVYKARQTALNRICAVKVLAESVAKDPSFVERFFREGRAAAAVNHPSIIQVYDTGQEQGLYYIAMEFVEGEHLGAAMARDGPLPPDAALGVLKQVASALDAAHKLGIVHRDIKPANLLRTADGQVKVADFGLAKRSGVDITVTAAGARLGTPLYLPPEVANGEKADTRSDLYSLGATLYHLAAGHSPFEAGSISGVLMKQLETLAPPLDQVVPGAPPVLVRALDRLLRKDPKERYQSAKELLDALESPEAPTEVLSSAGPDAKAAPTPPSAEARPQAAGRRKRRILLLAAVAVALALIVVGILFLLGKL